MKALKHGERSSLISVKLGRKRLENGGRRILKLRRLSSSGIVSEIGKGSYPARRQRLVLAALRTLKDKNNALRDGMRSERENAKHWRDGLSPALVKCVENSISALFSTIATEAAILEDGFATDAIGCSESLRIPLYYSVN